MCMKYVLGLTIICFANSCVICVNQINTLDNSEKINSISVINSFINASHLRVNIDGVKCFEAFIGVCGSERKRTPFTKWLQTKYNQNITLNFTDPCFLRQECLLFSRFEWNNSFERLIINNLKQWVRPSMQMANLCILLFFLSPAFSKLHTKQPLISFWFYMKSVSISAVLYHVLFDIPNIVVRLIMISEEDVKIERYSHLANLGQTTCCAMNFIKSTILHCQNWLILVIMCELLYHCRRNLIQNVETNTVTDQVTCEQETSEKSPLHSIIIVIAEPKDIHPVQRFPITNSTKSEFQQFVHSPKRIDKIFLQESFRSTFFIPSISQNIYRDEMDDGMSIFNIFVQ